MAFTPRSTREHRARTKAPAIRLREKRFTSSEVQQTLSRANIDPFEGRRTMRTWMRAIDGSYVPAKIDLETGEVVPHPYAIQKKQTRLIAKSSNAEAAPPWVTIPPPEYGAANSLKLKTVRKEMLNPMRGALKGYSTLDAVFSDFPYFENIFLGSLILDMGGNTRTLSPTLIFALLQTLKTISSETIQSFMGCSERHAQKIGVTLRVLITAFVKEREKEAARGIYRGRIKDAIDADDEWTAPTIDEGLLIAA